MSAALVAVCGLTGGAGTTTLARLLAREHAAAALGATIADCGRLESAEAHATLARASHVVWTVAADPQAGETARALLLESRLAPPAGSAVELLAVVAVRRAAFTPGSHRALRELVAERLERLVLVPYARALAGGRRASAAPRRAAAALAAIDAVLQRVPAR